MRQIHVEVESSASRRDDVERRTFEAIDAMRAATSAPPTSASRRAQLEDRIFARVDALADEARVATYARPRATRAWWLGAGAAAALAATVAIIVARPAERAAAIVREPSPSRVVTPATGGSRFTVGDAVIDAGSSTSVDVTHAPSGAIALALARGSVECDVEHRPDRPPFLVVAGDITVRVVGTRFAVHRDGSVVRVEVMRGTVRVTGPDIDRLIGGGGSWTNATSIATATSRVPVAAADEPPPTAPPAQAPRGVSSRAAFEAAEQLEVSDPTAAVAAYRQLANGRGTWAALSLYSLAQLEAARGQRASAAAATAEYLRRFPRGTNADEAAWLRVEIARTAADRPALAAAVREYLRRFPAGTYAEPARQLGGVPP